MADNGGIDTHGGVPTGNPTATTAIGIPEGYKKPVHTINPAGGGLESLPGQTSPSPTYRFNPDSGKMESTGFTERTMPFSPFGTESGQFVNGSYGTATYTEQDVLAPNNTGPDRIYGLQVALVQAGLLNPKDVRPGLWDAKSQSAYRTALAFANQNGMTDRDAITTLTQIQSASSAKKALGTGTQTRVEQFTNPENAKKAYRDTYQRLTGGTPSDQDAAAFAGAFAAQEKQAADAYYNAAKSAPGKGGYAAAPAPPQLDVAAEDWVKQHDPSGVMGMGVATRMQDFYSMLAGAEGGSL